MKITKTQRTFSKKSEAEKFVRSVLERSQYDEKEIKLFLAGASLLGCLSNIGPAWWRDHRISLLENAMKDGQRIPRSLP